MDLVNKNEGRHSSVKRFEQSQSIKERENKLSALDTLDENKIEIGKILHNTYNTEEIFGPHKRLHYINMRLYELVEKPEN